MYQIMFILMYVYNTMWCCFSLSFLSVRLCYSRAHHVVYSLAFNLVEHGNIDSKIMMMFDLFDKGTCSLFILHAFVCLHIWVILSLYSVLRTAQLYLMYLHSIRSVCKYFWNVTLRNVMVYVRTCMYKVCM